MNGESILIAEDDGLIALSLTELLERKGYRIIGPAYSGEMVLRALEESPLPSLILMDIGLAGAMDGIETARQIRQRFSIPLIFLTAYTSESKLERIREVAPDGYLMKPYLECDLLAVIRKAIDKRAA
jgi:CheY-like chemotaxis protein